MRLQDSGHEGVPVGGAAALGGSRSVGSDVWVGQGVEEADLWAMGGVVVREEQHKVQRHVGQRPLGSPDCTGGKGLKSLQATAYRGR